MAHRVTEQASFAEALMRPGLGENAQLARIDGLIDWSAVDGVLSGLRPGGRGQPPYPARLMFKALLLQQWYGLTDPGLEAALADRLSFRRFVGLGLDDPTPDHTTLWRFREALGKADLAEALFAEVVRQIEAKGLVLKRGTLVDATVVEAQAARPPKGVGVSRSDPDARWGRKGNRTTFSYKAHIGVDQESRIVRRALLTPGNVNDTTPADDLIVGDEFAVYADAAYDTKARRKKLRELGIQARIAHRPNKHHPELPPRKKLMNRWVARGRWQVEAAFGVMKRHYNYRRVRYYNRMRNASQLLLMCTAMNLRRMEKLTA